MNTFFTCATKAFENPLVRFAVPLLVMGLLALFPHPAYASCGSGLSLDSVNGPLEAIGYAFSNTYVKIGLIVGLAVAGLILMFDGGQLPQFAKLGISVLIGVGLLFALLGWLGSQGGSCITAS